MLTNQDDESAALSYSMSGILYALTLSNKFPRFGFASPACVGFAWLWMMTISLFRFLDCFLRAQCRSISLWRNIEHLQWIFLWIIPVSSSVQRWKQQRFAVFFLRLELFSTTNISNQNCWRLVACTFNNSWWLHSFTIQICKPFLATWHARVFCTTARLTFRNLCMVRLCKCSCSQSKHQVQVSGTEGLFCCVVHRVSKSQAEQSWHHQFVHTNHVPASNFLLKCWLHKTAKMQTVTKSLLTHCRKFYLKLSSRRMPRAARVCHSKIGEEKFLIGCSQRWGQGDATGQILVLQFCVCSAILFHFTCRDEWPWSNVIKKACWSHFERFVHLTTMRFTVDRNHCGRSKLDVSSSSLSRKLAMLFMATRDTLVVRKRNRSSCPWLTSLRSRKEWKHCSFPASFELLVSCGGQWLGGSSPLIHSELSPNERPQVSNSRRQSELCELHST